MAVLLPPGLQHSADHILFGPLVRGVVRRRGYPDVTLHRLRHSVATALVSRGDILQAQYRLGHRDAATTLRTYSHVLPLTDADAAATLDQLYEAGTVRGIGIPVGRQLSRSVDGSG